MATYRMHAALNRAFLFAVQGTQAGTVNLDLVAPDAATSTLNLLDADGDGIHRLSFTPALVGTYTITIDAAGSAIHGLTAELIVSTSTVPVIASGNPFDAGPEGVNLRWPCATLASLPCVSAYSIDQIRRWLDIATTTLHGDLCRRFPGVHNYAKVRPALGGGCFTLLGSGSLGVDLWPSVRYPIVELCDVFVNGAALGPAGWRIEGKRYLVPEGSTAWPTQDFTKADGASDTYAVLVRYGRPPPAMAVAGRDQLMMSMMFGNEAPDSETCTINDQGVVSVTENGRTMTYDPAAAAANRLYAEARKRWKCPKREASSMSDPAEATAAGAQIVRVVSGDFTPAAAAAFFPSGCDLDAQLADLNP